MGQATGNTTSLDSPWPGLGGSHHLPPYSILCVTSPLGRPSGPLARIGIRTIRLALSKPLKLNGFTAKYLGRVRLPFRGACSPPYTFLISLMNEGVVASLPKKGSPCVTPRRLHPNGFLSQDYQSGVPKLSRFGLPGLWTIIASHPNLRWGQGLNQCCSSRRELSNTVLHSPSARWKRVDSVATLALAHDQGKGVARLRAYK